MGAAAIPAAIPAALVGGGSILSAFNQMQSGKSAVATAQRQQDYYNTQANQVINQGDYQSDLVTERGNQAAAAAKTGFAAGGIDTSSGTAARVQQSSIDAAEADATQIRKNAFNQAFGLVQQGNEAVKQAAASKSSSLFGSFGSLLTGGGAAYNMFRKG